jgi:C-terminal processing protease CtpA/Prc
LDKDFDKFSVPSQKVDGVEVKKIDEETKVVKRPPSKKGQDPTLEVQPEKKGSRIEDSVRIKVRYKKI